MNLRFSLLSLIGLTTLAGLASAALAKPSVEWLSVVVSLTVGAIFVQAFRALLFGGPSRAAAIGWLFFVTAYLALTIGPWLNTHVGPQLVTSQALAYAQAHWRKDSPPAYVHDVSRLNVNQVWIDLMSGRRTNTLEYANELWTIGGDTFMASSNHFQLSGHWLCAWLAGWLGAALATHFHAKSRAHSATGHHTGSRFKASRAVRHS
jgi:hypothetical protein